MAGQLPLVWIFASAVKITDNLYQLFTGRNGGKYPRSTLNENEVINCFGIYYSHSTQKTSLIP